MIGIYRIISPSGKIYIGQSWKIENRKSKYRTLGCKSQVYLYNSLLQYGFENHKFEVVHELPTDTSQEVLDNYEILYYNQYKDCDFKMMNIREPGSRGKSSLETRNKQRDSMLKLNLKHTPESITKIKIARSKQIITQEHKDKTSKSLKGIIRPKGRKMSQKIKDKIRLTKLLKAKERGYFFSKETNIKRGLACKKAWESKIQLKN